MLAARLLLIRKTLLTGMPSPLVVRKHTLSNGPECLRGLVCSINLKQLFKLNSLGRVPLPATVISGYPPVSRPKALRARRGMLTWSCYPVKPTTVVRVLVSVLLVSSLVLSTVRLTE